jgi:hypothetical protein
MSGARCSHVGITERRINSRYSRSFVLFSFNHFVKRKPPHRACLVSGRSIYMYRNHRYKNHRYVDKPTSVFYLSIGVPVYVCACVSARASVSHILCACICVSCSPSVLYIWYISKQVEEKRRGGNYCRYLKKKKKVYFIIPLAVENRYYL